MVGALGIDRSFDESYSLKQGKRLLLIIATMIAQHVINLETIQFEKNQLTFTGGNGAQRSSRPSERVASAHYS